MRDIKSEILAPVGSLESMKAVINAGCDAIYLGGNEFSARAYANNFDEEILLKVIDEAHVKGVKVYLTVNTLLKEVELRDSLYNFLYKPYINGLDAVIVQDMGVVNFIHRNFPKLHIHLSTQTTLMMAEGMNLFKNYGVNRIVTARELTINEIKKIRDNSDLEIETFVHGALCYSYSGQCLMSSMIGGRSGNRGRCAQPCRMEYGLYNNNNLLTNESNKYVLSPKDICTAELIPEMVEAGINSFKIEGRMKSPYYAALVTNFYRKHLDLYYELGKERFKERANLNNQEYIDEITKLQDIYNRGNFSKGYLFDYSGKKMMSMDRPNHTGVFVGEVLDNKKGVLKILLVKDINPQDILEIRGKEAVYEFTAGSKVHKDNTITTKYLISRGKEDFKKGDKVFRTKNNKLINDIKKEFLEADKKISVEGYFKARIGENFSFKIISKLHNTEVEVFGTIVEEALNQGISSANIHKQLNKTGKTSFCFSNIDIGLDDGAFISLKSINDIRREGIALLEEKIIKKHARGNEYNKNNLSINHNINSVNSIEKLGITVLVQSINQLNIVVNKKEVNNIYLDLDFLRMKEIKEFLLINKVEDKELYLALPRIIRPKTYKNLINNKEFLLDQNFKGYIIRNFEAIGLLKDIGSNKELIMDYNMYVYNNEAKEFFMNMNAKRLTAPVELNSKELKELEITGFDMIVYGYTPVMVSTQCVYKNTIACVKDKDEYVSNNMLVDKKGMGFLVKLNCKDCYNIIYNSRVLSLLKYASEIKALNLGSIRIDFTVEAGEDVDKILNEYIRVFKYDEKIESVIKDITFGHFKRGII